MRHTSPAPAAERAVKAHFTSASIHGSRCIDKKEITPYSTLSTETLQYTAEGVPKTQNITLVNKLLSNLGRDKTNCRLFSIYVSLSICRKKRTIKVKIFSSTLKYPVWRRKSGCVTTRDS
jgi:hypothetical protein